MIPLYEGNQAINYLNELCRPDRPSLNDVDIERDVAAIIKQVKQDGDSALRDLAKKHGDPIPDDSFMLERSAIETAASRVKEADKETMQKAAKRIIALGNAVMQSIKPVSIQYADFAVGVNFSPVARVGCYVPSGLHPLPSTALMTALTARVAGVAEVCLLSPKLANEIVYAGTLANVTEFYQVGGAQAIAAATFGTDTIKPVDIIVGPGNRYVTEAKRQLQGCVGIDMLAGPSEIVIISDSRSNPNWLALDLLSQIEHGPDSRGYLLTDSLELGRAVQHEISSLIAISNLGHLTQAILESAIFVLDSINLCSDVVNKLAPEHLSLQVERPELVYPDLKNYGALFLGTNATVPYGDYMSGANHTLPTNRCARFYGALTPLTFLRAQNWLKVPEPAMELSKDTIRFAQLEGLDLHAAAAFARLG